MTAKERSTTDPLQLAFREREILESVYRLGRATVADVVAALVKPPSYSAVRAILGKLQRKGFLLSRPEGARYVYTPVAPREEAAARGLRRVVNSLFEGSTRRTLVALLDTAEDLPARELRELRELISRSRERGRR
jgi:predicted transcriptional regulator